VADEKVTLNKAPSEVPKVVAPEETKAPSGAELMELLQKVARLEAKVEAKPAAPAQTPAPEIDWSRVTEREVADLNFPIPVIEHELPEYMTVYLKDNSYIAKWSHITQRRIGRLLAEGYEYVTPEDWDQNFPQILKFDSEGHLTFDDVVAVKIHKSRFYGKIRRENEKAMQIRGISGYDKVKGKLGQAIANIPGMESAINRGAMSFYGEKADSAVEVQI
jgi:hypothetical protein